MPTPMKERITIGKFYCLCVDGQPMGSMFDMGSSGKRGIQFPTQSTGLKATKEEAKEAKIKMLAYVEDICSLPRDKRPGSAKRW